MGANSVSKTLYRSAKVEVSKYPGLKKSRREKLHHSAHTPHPKTQERKGKLQVQEGRGKENEAEVPQLRIRYFFEKETPFLEKEQLSRNLVHKKIFKLPVKDG